MKKFVFILFLGAIVSMISFSSCRSTCPAYDTTTIKANKKTGKLPTRRGNSNLFPKKMRRK
jgi:hypothetical protein